MKNNCIPHPNPPPPPLTIISIFLNSLMCLKGDIINVWIDRYLVLFGRRATLQATYVCWSLGPFKNVGTFDCKLHCYTKFINNDWLIGCIKFELFVLN